MNTKTLFAILAASALTFGLVACTIGEGTDDDEKDPGAAGGGGNGGGGSANGGTGSGATTPQDCDSCTEKACAADKAACEADTDCSDILTCYRNCTKPDGDECWADCDDSANELFTIYYYCPDDVAAQGGACEQICAPTCDQCVMGECADEWANCQKDYLCKQTALCVSNCPVDDGAKYNDCVDACIEANQSQTYEAFDQCTVDAYKPGAACHSACS